MNLFRDVIKTVVEKLRAKYKNRKQNCCYIWLTLLTPDYQDGINLGGICLFNPIEDIVNEFMVAAYVSFSSNTSLPLDNR